MTERHILTAENCQHPNAMTQVTHKGNGWYEHSATCRQCRTTISMCVKSPAGKELAPIRMVVMEYLVNTYSEAVNTCADLPKTPPWILKEIERTASHD